MQRLLVLAVFVAIVGLVAVSAPRVGSQEKQDDAKAKPRSPATSASLRQWLSTRVDLPGDFKTGPVPVKTVLKFLQDSAAQRGEQVAFHIDRQAFKDAAADPTLVTDENIDFPAVPSMTVEQCLRSLTRQLPTDARYRIRDGIIDITTADAIQPLVAIKQNVSVDFRNAPLGSAIEELSDMTGLSIALHPACEEMPRKNITLRANNDLTLHGVLATIADTCNLKLIAAKDRVMLIPQAVYLKRLHDQLEEAEIRSKLKKLNPAPEPPAFQFMPGSGYKPGARIK